MARLLQLCCVGLAFLTGVASAEWVAGAGLEGSEQLNAHVQGTLGRSLLASAHKYETNDIIKLYANKVGPFSNPRWSPLSRSSKAGGHARVLLVV